MPRDDGSSYPGFWPPQLISSAQVSALFGKPQTWFSRDRVRKSLYARSFPRPVIRGRWSRSAVTAWLEREGKCSR
jgi:predicted DNA-binding transcriptional regulator AlpA